MDDPKISFFDAILALESEEECRKFLDDLLTPQELIAIENRWKVLLLLDEGLPQREVRNRVGGGISTVSRVNKMLKFGGGGYRLIVEKLKKKEPNT